MAVMSGISVHDDGMARLFLILSTPVRLRDNAFVIVIGSMRGIEVKEFPTLRRANNHYRRLVLSLGMSVEMPVDVVLIEGETDYLPLRKRFDRAYEQRVFV
jgi:hypothetical protein